MEPRLEGTNTSVPIDVGGRKNAVNSEYTYIFMNIHINFQFNFEKGQKLKFIFDRVMRISYNKASLFDESA